jgi:hypothetical protein
MSELLMAVSAGLLLVLAAFLLINYVSHRLYPIRIKSEVQRSQLATNPVRGRANERLNQRMNSDHR